MKNIEFLSGVNIREVWKREDKDFTPWLASEEPISQLLTECGIDIGSDYEIFQEYQIPGMRRRLDLLVETEADGRIAIENQYSEADHDHLTRAMAYGVALEARAVIVIAENHRPEFVELARYLNSSALAYREKGIPLFLVKITVHSEPNTTTYFPSFELAAGPEEWKSVVTRSFQEDGNNRDALIYDYFDRLLPSLQASTGVFNNVNPSSNNWQSGSAGMSGVSVCVSAAKNHSTVQIWFNRTSELENHAGLDVLHQYKNEIEDQFSDASLDWRKRATAIFEVKHKGIGYEDPSDVDLEIVSKTAGILYSFLQDHLDEVREKITQVQ
tara:strand:+ start:402 stop:1382 length:981 start_codon:yes stop_codon:yes gene_type:complete